MAKILITGGLGYIGSHTTVELLKQGHQVVIIDNLSNSSSDVLAQIEVITGQLPKFYKADFADTKIVNKIINTHKIDALIHFAALKAVGESVEQPLEYYLNNTAGFAALLKNIKDHSKIRTAIFSSTAAVYGTPSTLQVNETAPTKPESPYGWSKLMDEQILSDLCRSDSSFKGIALRYFNVIGSDKSCRIGESPKGKPQNLVPIIINNLKNNAELVINGNDYDTTDGTCLRDYINVVDLAAAHVAALNYCLKSAEGLFDVFNVGTGQPTSVLELISSFEKVNKLKVPYKIGPRRAGDAAAIYADAHKINQKLGWQATHTTEDSLSSAWGWANKKIIVN